MIADSLQRWEYLCNTIPTLLNNIPEEELSFKPLTLDFVIRDYVTPPGTSSPAISFLSIKTANGRYYRPFAVFMTACSQTGRIVVRRC